MVKFGRNYQLTIEGTDGTPIVIKPPFTLEFNIVRNNLSSVNNGVIRIYNLAQQTRSLLRHDRNDFGNIRRFYLEAGYGQMLSTIFAGTMTYAWSVREGVNFVTQVQGFDNGDAFVNGFYDGPPFAAQTPTKTIMQTIIESMPSVSVGVIGNYPDSITRAKSYSGNCMQILNELSGGGAFIDNGRVNVLGDQECLPAQVATISSDTGLLGTPMREERVLTFDMLFEPGLVVGQQINLVSTTGSNFNGQYKVVGVSHRGVISPTVSGEAVTSINLWYGLKALTTVPPT